MAVIESTEELASITAALRRIEGQCRGLQRMVDEGRTCAEILQQLSAARRALEVVTHDVAACTVEAEVADIGLSDAQRRRLRQALTQLRRVR